MSREAVEPPPEITLAVCTTCGRTDRWDVLRLRHFADGKVCPSTISKFVYRLNGYAP